MATLFFFIAFPIDINECEQGSAGCDHNCTNTAGSYNCACMDGYKLESDNHTCTGKECMLRLPSFHDQILS